MASPKTDNTEINSLQTLNEFLSKADNSENTFYITPVSEICKTSPCILGIDEAGRGPVLGPMVYGTSFSPIEKSEILKKLECADSKDLNEEKRDVIFSNICSSLDTVGWAVEVISPNTICNSMLKRAKYSLNAVSMDSAVTLIKAAENAGVNIEHIYVDTVGKPEKYQAYLLSIFPQYKITVAKKADSTYPIVSAASICAKVTRDHAMQTWKFQEGLDLTHKDIGSGYPGDPVTRKFLAEHCDEVFGFPQLVRFSWSTAGNMLDSEAYLVEWEDPEENEPEIPANTTSITSFFKVSPQKGIHSKKRKRHEFFTQRCLTNQVEF